MPGANGHHQLGINLSLNNASTWIHMMAHVHLHIQMGVCMHRQTKSCSVHPSPRWGCLGQWSVSPSSVRWVSLPFPGGAVAAGSCKKKLPCFCPARAPYHHYHCDGESLVYCSFPSVKPLLVLSNPDWGERGDPGRSCRMLGLVWLVNTAVLQQAEMGFPGKRLGIFNKLLPRGKMQNVSLLETGGGLALKFWTWEKTQSLTMIFVWKGIFNILFELPALEWVFL